MLVKTVVSPSVCLRQTGLLWVAERLLRFEEWPLTMDLFVYIRIISVMSLAYVRYFILWTEYCKFPTDRELFYLRRCKFVLLARLQIRACMYCVCYGSTQYVLSSVLKTQFEVFDGPFVTVLILVNALHFPENLQSPWPTKQRGSEVNC